MLSGVKCDSTWTLFVSLTETGRCAKHSGLFWFLGRFVPELSASMIAQIGVMQFLSPTPSPGDETGILMERLEDR